MKPCMFDAETLAAYAQRHELSPAVVRECADWVTERAGKGQVSNPNAMLEHLLARRADAMRVAAPSAGASRRDGEEVFFGFDPQGRTFRSSQPVTNAQTAFVQMLLREIPEQLLTPAECVWMLSRYPDGLADAFGLRAAAAWSQLERFDDWTRAVGETGMSACVVGNVRAIRERDARRWNAMVSEWCQREKQPSPEEVAAERARAGADYLPAGVIEQLERYAEQARLSRQAS